MTSSGNCCIYNRVISRNNAIFRYIDMSMQYIIYIDLEPRTFIYVNDAKRFDPMV